MNPHQTIVLIGGILFLSAITYAIYQWNKTREFFSIAGDCFMEFLYELASILAPLFIAIVAFGACYCIITFLLSLTHFIIYWHSPW